MRQIDAPLQIGSKAGHVFWYTVGAFEVTHNHITMRINTLHLELVQKPVLVQKPALEAHSSVSSVDAP